MKICVAVFVTRDFIVVHDPENIMQHKADEANAGLSAYTVVLLCQ